MLKMLSRLDEGKLFAVSGVCWCVFVTIVMFF